MDSTLQYMNQDLFVFWVSIVYTSAHLATTHCTTTIMQYTNHRPTDGQTPPFVGPRQLNSTRHLSLVLEKSCHSRVGDPVGVQLLGCSYSMHACIQACMDFLFL